MEIKQQIKQYWQQFRMNGMQIALEQIIKEAEKKSTGYLEFTASLLKAEVSYREHNDLNNRLKVARLPRSSDLEAYDQSVGNGLTKQRLNQLKELNWLDQLYNVVLMGPSGTGKTFLAAGLCAEAVNKGYKAYFRTMEEIMSILKMKDFARTAKADYKRLCKVELIVIDDIMLFPVEKSDAVSLFNFINHLYEKTSFIITTNKKPADWAEVLGDEVLATALLDRLLYKCEVISLSGKAIDYKTVKQSSQTSSSKNLSFCIPCCQIFCIIVANYSAFLIAKSSVLVVADYKTRRILEAPISGCEFCSSLITLRLPFLQPGSICSMACFTAKSLTG